MQYCVQSAQDAVELFVVMTARGDVTFNQHAYTPR
jgi:hypothetical protein